MEHTLDLVAERSVVRESLKGILWSIFFARLFGPVTPGTGSFFGITYPTATNLPDLDAQIDEQIDAFMVLNFGRSANHIQTAHLAILFFDKTPPQEKRKLSWFGKAPSPRKLRPVVWEKWDILVRCLPLDMDTGMQAGPASPMSARKTGHSSPSVEKSVASFELALLSIIDIADAHKDHIPPITLLESAPFSFKILGVDARSPATADDKDNVEGWGTYIKKMLD